MTRMVRRRPMLGLSSLVLERPSESGSTLESSRQLPNPSNPMTSIVWQDIILASIYVKLIPLIKVFDATSSRHGPGAATWLLVLVASSKSLCAWEDQLDRLLYACKSGALGGLHYCYFTARSRLIPPTINGILYPQFRLTPLICDKHREM
ncbi:hypothetical protein BDN72DRAFT_876300 [Pluteus cervinus]|uniref:Uncharacterized protein n=1 Tax=Pluteus cervinus TaxID=181527 RepID=A0ACD3B3U1_9AGAR|nr:hypothetical protein BDN72DRAFT_876300 [Pluteus cervinus]